IRAFWAFDRSAAYKSTFITRTLILQSGSVSKESIQGFHFIGLKGAGLAFFEKERNCVAAMYIFGRVKCLFKLSARPLDFQRYQRKWDSFWVRKDLRIIFAD